MGYDRCSGWVVGLSKRRLIVLLSVVIGSPTVSSILTSHPVSSLFQCPCLWVHPCLYQLLLETATSHGAFHGYQNSHRNKNNKWQQRRACWLHSSLSLRHTGR